MFTCIASWCVACRCVACRHEAWRAASPISLTARPEATGAMQMRIERWQRVATGGNGWLVRRPSQTISVHGVDGSQRCSVSPRSIRSSIVLSWKLQELVVNSGPFHPGLLSTCFGLEPPIEGWLFHVTVPDQDTEDTYFFLSLQYSVRFLESISFSPPELRTPHKSNLI